MLLWSHIEGRICLMLLDYTKKRSVYMLYESAFDQMQFDMQIRVLSISLWEAICWQIEAPAHLGGFLAGAAIKPE